MYERILLIIPAYNEEHNILSAYNQIISFNDTHQEKYDVIVINDGSTDGTGQICIENNIPCINLVHNLGIGGAVQTGYKYALKKGYDIAVQFDGDGQHDVNHVINIISPILNGEAEFVIGSRFTTGNDETFKSSRMRRIGIVLISFFIRITTGVKVHDTTSGFRAVNKNIIALFSSSYPSEYPEPITTTELLRKKFIFKEVPVQMHERAGGESSIKAWKTIYYMINVILTILIIRIRRYPHVH